MLVSVIMLTHNRSSLVANMIGDILHQTHQDYEFIIVNNGSTDNTSSVLQKYALMDNRIKIISIPDSTIGRARNIGLAESIGKYIAYVDDDDRAKPDYLEFLLDLIMGYDADISMCGATEGDGTFRAPQCLFDEKYVLPGEDAVRMLMERRYIRNGTATKLYRREILEQFPFVENYKNEDLHTQYKYLLASKVVVIHGLDKYYITRHSSNVSGFTSDASKWDEETIRGYLDAYHNRTVYIRENAPSIFHLALYSEWSFMISMINKIEAYNLDDCRELETNLIMELTSHKKEFLECAEIKDFEVEWVLTYIH